MKPGRARLKKSGIVPGCRWGVARKHEFVTTTAAYPDETVELMEAFEVSQEELSDWIRKVHEGGSDALFIKRRHQRRRIR